MELDLIQARHALNVAMGRSPNAELIVIPDTTISTPEHDAVYWFDHAKKHNAGLRMAEISQNIAESEYGIAKAAFWPVVAANGSLSQNFGDSEQKRLSAGLTLSWPIFTGFRTLTAAQNAKLDTKSAEYSLEQELKQLEALIYAQYERQQNAYNQINFERQAVQLAQQSLDVSQEQYALGGISDVQLREAQLALTQSQVRFQSALFQYKVTSMQLEQLAGTLRIK
jgi:outer membrane protein